MNTEPERFVSAAGVECAGCQQTVTDGIWRHDEHWCDSCAPVAPSTAAALATYSAPYAVDHAGHGGRVWYVREETTSDGWGTVRIRITGPDDTTYARPVPYDSRCILCQLNGPHSLAQHAADVVAYLAQAEQYRAQLRRSNVGVALKRRLFEMSDYGRRGLTYDDGNGGEA